MRYMAMHRSSANDEAGIPPGPELIEGIGRLIQEGVERGAFLGGEGLKASRHRVRLQFKGGERAVTAGPFGGSDHLLSGFALIKARSMDEAVGWGDRIAKAIARDVEIEVGPVCEPWDLGMGEKPKGDFPTRFLILHKAHEPEGKGSPNAAAALSSLKAEMAAADVLILMESLLESARSVRLKFEGAKRTTIDGPFAESKELIAGFSLLKFDTMAEIVEWTAHFGRLFPAVEVDIRPLQESA